MANYVKFFVNPMFNREQFADMLNCKMNVKAKAVEDGVILDRDAFNAVSAAYMPHWAWLNKKSINSNLHTRPATAEEIPDDINPRYTLMELMNDEWRDVEKSNLKDYIISASVNYQNLWRGCRKFFHGVAIVDNETGEVIYETTWG